MRELLKDAGKGTLVAIAMLIFIAILVVVEKLTSLDYKLLIVVGGFGLGFRYLNLKAKEIELNQKNAERTCRRNELKAKKDALIVLNELIDEGKVVVDEEDDSENKKDE